MLAVVGEHCIYAFFLHYQYTPLYDLLKMGDFLRKQPPLRCRCSSASERQFIVIYLSEAAIAGRIAAAR